jgi:hypothetical protein
METYRKIMNWKETLEFPEDIALSPEALDLLKKLITGKYDVLKESKEDWKENMF